MKLDIAIAVPGMKLYPGVFEKESVGGSETAGYQMARALARRGNQVYLFCNIERPAKDDVGVQFFPITQFIEHVHNIPHDVTIVERVPEMLYKRTESRLNVLWMHDLPLGRMTSTMRGAIWNVDQVFLLSQFQKERFQKVYGLKDKTVWVTRNGIDLDQICAAPPSRARNRDILYAARPERGVENLLAMMPEIRKRVPDATLKLCTYDNAADALAGYYAKINAQIAKLGDAVKFVGNLKKVELYELMKSCRVYAYPVPAKEGVLQNFAEISCIAAMEAQACGLPIVATAHGALPETIHPEAGVLVDGLPWEEKPRAEFIDAICRFLTDDEAVEKAAQAGRRRGDDLGWDSLADEWEARFMEQIAANNDFSTPRGVRRLARHFWRQSDIFAMKKLGELISGDEDTVAQQREIDQLYEPYRFIESAQATKEHYAVGNYHSPDLFPEICKEPRFDVLARFVAGHRKEVATVLDYGCGMGGYAFFLAQKTGVKAVGIDIDDATIKIAKAKAAELDPDGKAHTEFFVGTHDDLSAVADESMDMATLQEVLEHVLDPGAVISAVEKKVRKDGFVYITVPFGPWEFETYEKQLRAHVHHFDKHDIRDLLGAKKDLTIHALMIGRSAKLDNSLGWWIVSYRADHAPLGKIDWERKLRLQKPRQTVSLCVMAGGQHADETLHWMLRTLKPLVDDILVADCGLSDEAKHILAQYPVRIVPSVNPTTDGFETPRNHLLDVVDTDWAFSVDTDERVLNPENIDKYLRNNELNGYGVQQHHFAVDTNWHPDLPVRLFRNGIGLRYFGMIHEHPELELNKGPGECIVAGDIHVAHLGYLVEGIRQGRFGRNWPMLEADKKKYPTRDIQKHFVIRDTMLLVQRAWVRNSGVLTDEMKAKLEEVIQLFRDHFIDKPVSSKNLDVVEYYSTAVAMLGRGFEVAFAVDAAKEGFDGDLSPQKIRFDTKDDCLRFMKARTEGKIDPLTSPDY